MHISVAMATYNGERYLEEQLRSIAAQHLLPAELVVSDDGSTDTTLEILSAFARHAPFPIRILPRHDRLGFADNFLHAAAACSSDLVAFSDQDDVWLPHKLATAHGRLTADGSLLAMHRLTLVDDDLVPYGIHDQGIERDMCFAPLALDPYITGWGNTMLFHRDLALLIPRTERPRQPEAQRPLSHDTWIYVLAAALGRVSHIHEPLILYRQHEANIYGVASVGGSWARLAARLNAIRTIPLATHRERVIFDTRMTDLLAALARQAASGWRSVAANAAARFAERAERRSRRVSLYDAASIRTRIACWIDMLRVSPRSDEARTARRRSAIKDLLLGVTNIGQRR